MRWLVVLLFALAACDQWPQKDLEPIPPEHLPEGCEARTAEEDC